MSTLHYRDTWPGPAGQIELLFDRPEQPPRGMALIAHPHPLLGGNAEHKVPGILAKSLRHDDWLSVRPNFRGIGATEGQHDDGVGEAQDLIAVASRLREEHPGLPLVLIGFSFGAFVQIRVSQALAEAGAPAAQLVLLGPGIGQVSRGKLYQADEVPPHTLVIHGEKDQQVPLDNIFRWAEPQALPVVVIPGADHFFSRRLQVLARLVRFQLAGVSIDP